MVHAVGHTRTSAPRPFQGGPSHSCQTGSFLHRSLPQCGKGREPEHIDMGAHVHEREALCLVDSLGIFCPRPLACHT